MPKTYRVGMIGFGMIGPVHAYGYLNLRLFYDPPPLEARITHVVTSRPETAERARRRIGADVAATDYRVVTENPEIDIVHICTPNHLHKDALLSAMRHGKHIYCDKPLVASMDEAEQIRAALPDYHGVAQMTFHNRFFPATLRAKQLIEQGVVGEVLQFRAAYLHGGSANPEAPLKWKLTSAAGGGVIADLASHVLDLIDHLIGPFASFTALTHTAYPERPLADDPSRTARVDAEDCVLATARLASGAVGTVEATKLASGAEDELRFEIHGSLGALRFNLMDPHHLEYYDATAISEPVGGRRGWTRIDTGQRYPQPATGFPSPKAAIGWVRAHAACLANFLQAVAEGRPAEPGLEQGIRVQHLMDCLHRSARTGRPVDV
ncbi:MAG: Gfo/Idh/MocA family oxidoreductase [Planctomycetes bacterium]|nr:Gfo/Idh/MocA family oxidoreductase [Planctomycetota bacterium]